MMCVFYFCSAKILTVTVTFKDTLVYTHASLRTCLLFVYVRQHAAALRVQPAPVNPQDHIMTVKGRVCVHVAPIDEAEVRC